MDKEDIDQNLSKIGKDRHWLAEKTRYSYDTLRNRIAPNAKKLSFAMSTRIQQAFDEHEKKSKPSKLVIECFPDQETFESWSDAGLLDKDDNFNDFTISRINKLAESINELDEPLDSSNRNGGEEKRNA